MEVNEQKIVKLCKQGRREGYELLFNKYRHFIYSVCRHYVDSQEDALDLTQEVYIKLYRHMEKFAEGRPLVPWVRMIAVNTCLNHIRSAAKQAINHLVFESDIYSAVTNVGNPEEQAVFNSSKTILEQCISELPHDERMALILRHVHHLSYDEISSTMGCPLGTVKTYIHRARGQLRVKLKNAGVWEE